MAELAETILQASPDLAHTLLHASSAAGDLRTVTCELRAPLESWLANTTSTHLGYQSEPTQLFACWQRHGANRPRRGTLLRSPQELNRSPR
jgi:ABC-type transporter Mla subunit MlaD